ncbi:hypothetical protein QBA57_28730 [Streptomyces scabiei]|uniref:hypothetical protein n=1 Tax=Streptomyces scabiei TaxID=1930 RepID=UPI001B338853|nr:MULTISPECIES: hypothetical protein [Streptomyces]MBP5883146.1 hypothetical protein [Streptomyces sp. LBUM 1487]MDX2628612.1 hypothetical protein [Streptomyces scabiei]MDX3162722.1 hypothetical protein [Streptomyces scabiei]
MSTDDRVQSVRNAWTNALRAEVLRVGRTIPEVARVVTVGMWISTYADADGSNAFPARDTLATLSGCSQETVTRSVKVLMGVGVLTRKRRPNSSAVYQLLIPVGGKGLPWAAHIHHMTDTRQRKAHAKKRAAETAEAVAALEVEMTRRASMDVVRTASTDAVDTAGNSPDSVRGRLPDSVRVGGSEPPPEVPDSVHGRPRTASVDAFRTASVDAPTSSFSTSGRDPLPDHNMAGLSPQPQPRASEAAKDESSTGQGESATAEAAGEDDPDGIAAILARPPLTRCRECHLPLLRPGRDLCHGCEAYLNDTGRHSA